MDFDKKQVLKSLYAGHHFRNNFFPDAGNRYKLKVNNLGTWYIVKVGDEFDLTERTSIYQVEKLHEDKLEITISYQPPLSQFINFENIEFDMKT